MLARKHRINKKLFKEILKKGKSFHSDLISLKTAPIGNNPLFSFVVSKKTAKKAVARNKLKRRGRYIVKKHLTLFKGGAANIIFFKKGSEKLSFQELEKELNLVFQKAKII